MPTPITLTASQARKLKLPVAKKRTKKQGATPESNEQKEPYVHPLTKRHATNLLVAWLASGRVPRILHVASIGT